MRGTALRPSLRRRTGPLAGVTAGVVALGVLAGCGGAPDPGAAVGATPLAASTASSAAGASKRAAAEAGATNAGATNAGATDASARGGGTAQPADGGPAASRPGAASVVDAGPGSNPAGVTGSPAPSALPPGALGGALAGLDCRARVHSAVGRSLFAHEIAGGTTRLVEQQGLLEFAPVRLGSGGGVGDIGSGLESFVATDPQGRLHYLLVELLRENTDGPVVADVATDAVLGDGFGSVRAVGASIVGHAYGDPEVFVVDADGRLMRHTISAQGRTVSMSAPTVLATGLSQVTALSVDTFDLDGDLAQERAAASRVVVVDGGVLRQTIVRRDGSAEPLTVVAGPRAEAGGGAAVTRMWCAAPGGRMVEQGALVVFDRGGSGRVFAGGYTPAVREPSLAEVGTTDPIPGLIAG